MKFNFSRKSYGQISVTDYWTKFYPKDEKLFNWKGQNYWILGGYKQKSFKFQIRYSRN
jgi:hypothetical protein